MFRTITMLIPAAVFTGTIFLCQMAWGATANKTISVTTTDFKFEPNAWTVAAGQPVTLTITNRGTTEHEWVLLKRGTAVVPPFGEQDEEKVFWEIEADPGTTQTATFTAPKEIGTYQVICGVSGHLEEGMKANLIVK